MAAQISQLEGLFGYVMVYKAAGHVVTARHA
jgi:hypothetical protein